MAEMGGAIGSVLEGLNEEQLKAVTTTEGYVRVVAGAGSGKTRALARRFAYLVLELGVMARAIACVTFTNKAANEMRARIHALTGDNDSAYVNTFHGLCVSILQESGHALGLPKSFLVLDNADIDQMLGLIYEERGLTLRDKTFSAARDMFEIRKCRDEPSYVLDLVSTSNEELRERYARADTVDDILFYGYLYQQKKCFGLDYNDLILVTLLLFERKSEVRELWQSRLEYVMIDEFQDIDALQVRLMDVLTAKHKNLFVVGDPDQTIYTWRGARVGFLLDFPLTHEPCTTIVMNKNYRSTPEILAAANSLIAHNSARIEKELLATRASGELPCAHAAVSDEDQAAWVAERIEELAGEGVAFGSMAVLYRAHYVTRALEEELLARELPYQLFSGVPFFERREVKDALAYLRLVAYGDDLSFMRVANVPKRNIGTQRMRFLQQFAAGQGITLLEALRRSLDDPLFKGTGARGLVGLVDAHSMGSAWASVSELFSQLMDESGFERALRTEGSQERLDNLAELRQSIFEFETTCGEEATLDRYLTHVALFSNLDAERKGQSVRLMTVHAAKGLEFDNVFLLGMSEGIFPSRKTKTREAMEEERRLAFVAMTRARKRLILSHADGTTHEGIPRYPSRFVLEVDEGLLRWDEAPSSEFIAEARAWVQGQMRVLELREMSCAHAAGARVRHKVFGEGTILSVDAEDACCVVQFDRIPTPRTLSARVLLEAL